MANKIEYYSSLAADTANRVKSEWPSFLNTAARMYKYPFQDQLLIYAQRPEASACASMEIWNTAANRWIRSGAKGIALIDTIDDGKTKLRYVFDVADTNPRNGSTQEFQLWSYRPEYEETVLRMLGETYGGKAENAGEAIDRISYKLANEYVDNHQEEIKEAIPYTTEYEFREFAAASCAYIIRARCGLDARFPDNFRLENLTQDGIENLGKAASSQSERVLREIETTIKKHERKLENERTDRINLQTGGGRGLSDTQSETAGTEGSQQIRRDADGLPEGTQAAILEQAYVPGDAERASARNRGDGDGPGRPADGRTPEDRPAAGQGERHDGMGAAHEQPAGASGRDSVYGTDLRITASAAATEATDPAKAQAHIPGLGDRYRIGTRLYEVEGIKENNVRMRDITFALSSGFPIFRDEQIGFFRDLTPENTPTAALEDTAASAETATRQTRAHVQKSLFDAPLMAGPVMPPELNQPTGDPRRASAEINFIRESYANRAIPEAEEIVSEPKPAKKHEPLAGERINFHITDLNLGEGGQKTKYGYNTEAIRTLKQIEDEFRHATPEEQTILSRYVGWGGLPQAFDGDNQQWAREYAELKELLSDDEYESARASTLNAHYTSPIVIQAMYETVERMGFKSGNILEPACGTGNFLGMLPGSMKQSKLYGVELDGLTGRIAQKLYPDANIQIKGFEKTDTPDATFDLAIGNVPFGGYGVADKRYDRHRFQIHDYFFAKTLDQIRPGGIIAFVTSQGTMDKQSPDARRYIAQRAELLGAVRLPNNAFLKNAGTEVTTDIIFLQRRERQVDIDADWIHRGVLENGIPVNSYFVDHPEQILGEMRRGNKLYGRDNDNSTACFPIEGSNLAEELRRALSRIEGQITEPAFENMPVASITGAVAAEPNVHNFSYAVINDTVYFRKDSLMLPVDKPVKTQERIKDMISLRDCARELIDYQLNDYSENDVIAKRRELNGLYDAFTKNHGLIHDAANKRAFKEDAGYYLLSALEILDEAGNLERKADIFTKRTVSAKQIITHVETPGEALAVSIAEKAKVDISYMAELTSFPEENIVADLQGVIFQNPEKWNGSELNTGWEAADEYLSGSVREKLETAKIYAKDHPQFEINVRVLEQSQPKDLDASEITVKLGSTWIPRNYIEQFVDETLKLPYHFRPLVNYSEYTDQWKVTPLNSADKVIIGVTYGTARADAFKIIEESLNLRDILIHDTIETVKGKATELNKAETTKAQQRQETIRQAFKDWVFKEPERRRTLVEIYNKKFNSRRPREFDGQHLRFPGMNPEANLRPHQRNGVARILYGGNTLLAHEVGAGKTYAMIAAAMEGKRLGLCNKSLIAVPKHLTEQFGSDFLKLYPAANILVAKTTDFEPENRKKFCARIATGDYDAIIIGHTQLEKLPLSRERQEKLLKEQIKDITDGIRELKNVRGDRYTVKDMEKLRKSLTEKLTSMLAEEKKDDVVTFEQLGCDRLFVDEAHGFKNLYLHTKMRNVAGISQSKADKTLDLFMKCRYMDEITGGKGVVFSTGTPVSNSMAETYTMQRYLQYDDLEKQGLQHFDAWASTFGETMTSVELAPQGGGYRARTRFKYCNLPELVTMFKNVADIQTADMMKLPRPAAKYETVVAQPTPLQKEMIAELSKRAAAVHNKLVEPEVDNMLLITGDGRKIGLDQRLINPLLDDDPGSKVNLCAKKVSDIWKETENNRLTQLVFCDLSTPGTGKDKKQFSIYTDLKTKLIANGIPAKEIAFVHDATTEEKKEKLFADVRAGRVRVLIGSTPKMGSGTNVQDRLIHLHNLDCPWKPAELEQRNGRILRQGNKNPEIGITNYVTDGTFDAYLYQTIEYKQKFISQIMTSKSPARNCDDMDETALSYAEIKALCIGDPRIKEKMDLDIEVARLKAARADHRKTINTLEDAIMIHYPRTIENTEKKIAGYLDDQKRLKMDTIPNKDGFSPMKIGKVTYTEKTQAGQALLNACKSITGREAVSVDIGTYRGFAIELKFSPVFHDFTATLKGDMRYTIALGTDVHGNITRLNNALEKIPELIEAAKQQLESTKQALEQAKEEVIKPFRHEEQFQKQSALLAELDMALSLDAEVPPTDPPPKAPDGIEKEQEPERRDLESTLNIPASYQKS